MPVKALLAGAVFLLMALGACSDMRRQSALEMAGAPPPLPPVGSSGDMRKDKAAKFIRQARILVEDAIKKVYVPGSFETFEGRTNAAVSIVKFRNEKYVEIDDRAAKRLAACREGERLAKVYMSGTFETNKDAEMAWRFRRPEGSWEQVLKAAVAFTVHTGHVPREIPSLIESVEGSQNEKTFARAIEAQLAYSVEAPHTKIKVGKRVKRGGALMESGLTAEEEARRVVEQSP